MASRKEKKFFPILLEDIVLSPGMDLQINSSQRVDWNRAPEDKNIDTIIRYLPSDMFI